MMGMEALEQREYKTKHSGMTSLLDLSEPRALNFADNQSMKTFLSKAAGTAYTIGVQESLGNTNFMPADDDIDSHESDLFGGYENDGFVEDPFHDEDAGIIANMDLLKGDIPNKTLDAAAARDAGEMADVREETILSPGKINCKVTNFEEIPKEPSAGQHEVIHTMQ
jgi:hypothetical protein